MHNHSFSYLVLTGPGGRVYWFLFVKLPIPLYGNDIPRYTKDDEARLAQAHALDQVTTTVRFGHIYEARTSSTLTPLHEHVFQKWHFGRIMTIGDAAHKVGRPIPKPTLCCSNHRRCEVPSVDWTRRQCCH